MGTVMSVTAGLTALADLKCAETTRIYRETEIERTWWLEEDQILTRVGAELAFRRGILVRVPRDGANYRLIGRLNGLPTGEPNLLRPQALALMLHSLKLWRERLSETFDAVRLAVTSLYRDVEGQRLLLNGDLGYRAVGLRESAHLAGAAFDISCRSYYLQAGGELVPVRAWCESMHPFYGEVFLPLRGVLEGLAAGGLCNFVVEDFVGWQSSALSVFHVCVCPKFNLDTIGR